MALSRDAEQISPEHGADQPFDTQPDCEICSKILLYAIQVDRTHESLYLGIAEDLLRSQCSHVALFEDWLHELLTHDARRAKSLVSMDHDSLTHGCIYFRSLAPGGYLSNHVSNRIGLLRNPTVPDHPGVMRGVDPQWINMAVLKQWITTCNTAHGVRCKELRFLKHLEAVRPKYLVDTIQMCIVEGEQVESGYIALSYQWGKAKTLRNTIELHERLLKPNALSDWDLARDIPQTVSDAFTVVKALSHRYLWVDALCVRQDDHVQLASELSRMHRIYHSADFTIVAADGSDAAHGLRGLEGLTAARNHSQVRWKLSVSDSVVIRHPSSVYSCSRGLKSYYTRAWTFQEFGFSVRRLVFIDDAVEWHCEYGQMREDVIGELPEPSHPLRFEESQRPTVHRLLAARMPTPESLSDLVSAFNTRSLSYPEDALPAFAGTQSLLEQFYQTGFLYGLPEFWFELALHWTPEGHIERRIPSSRCDTQTSYRLPSWSWIGWRGMIRFPSDDCDHIGPFGGRFTGSVTKWYTLACPGSLDRRPITPVWHQYWSGKLADHLRSIPQGWNQLSDKKRGFVFSHTRSYRKYSYPFPVPEPCSTSVSIPVPQTAYLSAQTSRAFLCGKPLHNKQYRLMQQHHIWLQSSQDQYTGFLYLNSAEQESLFEPKGSNSSSPNPLELVAISKGSSVDLMPPEIDWESELERSDTAWTAGGREGRKPIECMFVLWIEWEDGVAYRRACGVVHADVWEREREEELVDLILG